MWGTWLVPKTCPCPSSYAHTVWPSLTDMNAYARSVCGLLHMARSIKVSARTVLTRLAAICAFVYSCQTGLRNLTGVHLFSQDCPETCQLTVGVGTPTVLTHKNLNKRPAWRIALAKFIFIAVNLPLQRFYNTFTCPNVTLTFRFASCVSIKWPRARSIKVLDQFDWNREGHTNACPTNRWSVQTGAARPCWGLNNSLRLTN